MFELEIVIAGFVISCMSTYLGYVFFKISHQLAKAIATIEDYYTNLKGTWCPMDIEWVKDGSDGKIYIVQARPETVMSRSDANVLALVLRG